MLLSFFLATEAVIVTDSQSILCKVQNIHIGMSGYHTRTDPTYRIFYGYSIQIMLECKATHKWICWLQERQ